MSHPPAEQWYFAAQGQRRGPVAREALRGMIVAGQVRATDLVWSAGMVEWLPAQAVPELMAAPTPMQAGLVPDYAHAHYDVEFAGFWRRLVAWVIDVIVTSSIGTIGWMIMALSVEPAAWRGRDNWLSPAALALCWLYCAWMESSQYQATLGKLAMGIFVTDELGHQISFHRATGRFFGKLISTIPLYLGFMMAGWTQRKQALHDLMAGTFVVRRR